MALQYEDIQCIRLEKALKEGGARLGIFRSGDTSLLSRLHNESGLVASKLSEHLSVLLKKTDWELEPDKLKYKMPILGNNVKSSALEQLVSQGYFIGFDAKNNVITGYLIDPQKNIVSTRESENLSRLIQLLEIEAIKYL